MTQSPKPGARVSMMDIARHSGVSQKTVSRVVNGEAHVSPDVKAKVQQSIDELGFRPNAAARALVTQRFKRIGMVTIGTTLFGPTAILSGVEAAAKSAGYFLSVVRTGDGTPAQIQSAIDQLVTQGVDGIILSEPIDVGHPIMDVPMGLPVLSFDQPSSITRDHELVVGLDESAAARSATEHLLALGHETVWHIAGDENWAATRRRIQGWQEALSDAGAAEPAIIYGDWSPASGYAAAQSMLNRPDVTAIFAANDTMAVGAMRAFQLAGLNVPEDVSIVGFDDSPESAFLHTPLTTIRQDFDEVTRLAVHRLIRTIEGHPPTTLHRSVPAQLIIRESTARRSPERHHIRSI
ncbi:LacI family DNA-binding transcriptional regulator [Arthrobacter sp. TWP1-1]|uniref:LacI family DNA-binding transcriptional regulator n=1 Tax=Arthrobacter sp. TWP1-1 TaxID=2804568 RepID=UPI003CEC7605